MTKQITKSECDQCQETIFLAEGEFEVWLDKDGNACGEFEHCPVYCSGCGEVMEYATDQIFDFKNDEYTDECPNCCDHDGPTNADYWRATM